MASPNQPTSPSLPWRMGSSVIMGMTGSISRAFLFGFNSTNVEGLDNFLETLNDRADVDGRQRGLITGEPSKNSSPSASIDCLFDFQFQTMSVCTYVPHFSIPPFEALQRHLLTYSLTRQC